MEFKDTRAFAQALDEKDPLKKFRNSFNFPQHNGKDAIYFCGNSLGLQPKSTKIALEQELNDWAEYGVEGHFKAKHPWYSYHEMLSEPLSKIVGAKPHEVVAMNSLTVNLHLLMVSFYRPYGKRTKILCEHRPFSSDQYMLESQVRFHGLKPDENIIEMKPRAKEKCIRTEDIIAKIDEIGNELALVLFGGVNYYTGQLFDMETITNETHKVGAYAGFDLAHASGNVKLNMHDWKVDFAAWCGYKYLNSGPGCVAGIYIHEKHTSNPNMNRFAGWFGYDKETRFKMESGFVPIKTAEGWLLSNSPIFSLAMHKAALDVFNEAGMDALCTKSRLLTDYLEYTIKEVNRKLKKNIFEIITPSNPHERGCQLSVILSVGGKLLVKNLSEQGIVVDWREPNVMRMAPVPLYNSFEDVYNLGKAIKSFFE